MGRTCVGERPSEVHVQGRLRPAPCPGGGDVFRANERCRGWVEGRGNFQSAGGVAGEAGRGLQGVAGGPSGRAMQSKRECEVSVSGGRVDDPRGSLGTGSRGSRIPRCGGRRWGRSTMPTCPWAPQLWCERVNSENKAALEAWVRETGIRLVQVNGQRKYGGPPPGTRTRALWGMGKEGGVVRSRIRNPHAPPRLPALGEFCLHPSKVHRLSPRSRSPLGPFHGRSLTSPPRASRAGWVGSPPPAGSEVFIGRLPQDVYEHQLIPLFQRVGRLYEFRLMMTFSGLNRGFAYARYSSRRGAQAAIATLHNHQLRPACPLLVCRSTEKCELSVDGLPRALSRGALLLALQPLGPGLQEALLLPSPGPAPTQIALLKFSSHRAAAMAKKALVEGRVGVGSGGRAGWQGPGLGPKWPELGGQQA